MLSIMEKTLGGRERVCRMERNSDDSGWSPGSSSGGMLFEKKSKKLATDAVTNLSSIIPFKNSIYIAFYILYFPDIQGLLHPPKSDAAYDSLFQTATHAAHRFSPSVHAYVSLSDYNYTISTSTCTSCPPSPLERNLSSYFYCAAIFLPESPYCVCHASAAFAA